MLILRARSRRPYVWVEQREVISAMRRVFRKYPPYKQVRERCKREWFQDCKNGNKRRRVSFECEDCHTLVSAKDFKVDHIDPVVLPTEGFIDYNTYSKRLFCDVNNLQGLCKSCHDIKSKGEASLRSKVRREKKKNEPRSKSAKKAA